jgi:predicted nucleotide-binding protein
LALLKSANEHPLADELSAMTGDYVGQFWNEYRDAQVGHLEGRILLVETDTLNDDREGPVAHKAATPQLAANKVFLVHGHDNSSKESTARFLEKLGLEVVILHEKANEGRTVIEKFEFHSNVGFAVVLLTPDDVGAVATNPTALQGRARQNVILELGFFTGSLGRRRVCGLFRPGLEVPSDFHGVLFIEMDAQGGWKAKLAQELVTAGMQINIQALLQA